MSVIDELNYCKMRFKKSRPIPLTFQSESIYRCFASVWFDIDSFVVKKLHALYVHIYHCSGLAHKVHSKNRRRKKQIWLKTNNSEKTTKFKKTHKKQLDPSTDGS